MPAFARRRFDHPGFASGNLFFADEPIVEQREEFLVGAEIDAGMVDDDSSARHFGPTLAPLLGGFAHFLIHFGLLFGVKRLAVTRDQLPICLALHEDHFGGFRAILLYLAVLIATGPDAIFHEGIPLGLLV